MAAGLASRFGANKLLAAWRGRPLYQYLFDALPTELLTHTVVVSGSPEILREAARRSFETVVNDRPQDGPGRTVRLGLERLAGTDACLFSVCDQPELQPHSLRQLVASYAGGIRALSFDGRRGNPVIFPASLYGELLSLPDCGSGGQVLRAHSDLLTLSECGCCRELMDVDTPGEFRSLAVLRKLLLAGDGAAELLDEVRCLVQTTEQAGQNSPAATLARDLVPEEIRALVSDPGTLLVWSEDCSAADIQERVAQMEPVSCAAVCDEPK